MNLKILARKRFNLEFPLGLKDPELEIPEDVFGVGLCKEGESEQRRALGMPRNSWVFSENNMFDVL